MATMFANDMKWSSANLNSLTVALPQEQVV